MTSKNLAKIIANAALSKKGYDVAILDLRKLTTMTDYFVVCSVDSDTQARAVADAIKVHSVESGESSVRKEGYSEGRWILLDYVDVVAHVFHKEMRDYYNLEKLWGNAKIEYVSDSPVKKGTKSRIRPKTAARKIPKKKPVRKKSPKK